MKNLFIVLICLFSVGLAYNCNGYSKSECLENNDYYGYTSTKCCWLSAVIGLTGECMSVTMSNYKAELAALKLMYSGTINLDCSSTYLSLFSLLIFALLF
jgi:hypothetical protein